MFNWEYDISKLCQVLTSINEVTENKEDIIRARAHIKHAIYYLIVCDDISATQQTLATKPPVAPIFTTDIPF